MLAVAPRLLETLARVGLGTLQDLVGVAARTREAGAALAALDLDQLLLLRTGRRYVVEGPLDRRRWPETLDLHRGDIDAETQCARLRLKGMTETRLKLVPTCGEQTVDALSSEVLDGLGLGELAQQGLGLRGSDQEVARTLDGVLQHQGDIDQAQIRGGQLTLEPIARALGQVQLHGAHRCGLQPLDPLDGPG